MQLNRCLSSCYHVRQEYLSEIPSRFLLQKSNTRSNDVFYIPIYPITVGPIIGHACDTTSQSSHRLRALFSKVSIYCSKRGRFKLSS